MVLDPVSYNLLWWLGTLSQLALPIVWVCIGYHVAKSVRFFVEGVVDKCRLSVENQEK